MNVFNICESPGVDPILDITQTLESKVVTDEDFEADEYDEEA